MKVSQLSASGQWARGCCIHHMIGPEVRCPSQNRPYHSADRHMSITSLSAIPRLSFVVILLLLGRLFARI
jgi:hypothetical protein